MRLKMALVRVSILTLCSININYGFATKAAKEELQGSVMSNKMSHYNIIRLWSIMMTNTVAQPLSYLRRITQLLRKC